MIFTNRPKLNNDGTVPADYFDEDYWERGAESGKGSYNTCDYSNNLPLCQYWAMDTYQRWGPFETYLELGCGRGWAIWGFLHLAQGVKPLGVDVSHYAVTTAVKDVQPHLVEHDASDLGFLEDKSYDLIFSNDFLEHITPVQAHNCLYHCKRIAKKRVVHLISIGTDVDMPAGVAPGDQDQSHINMKSTSWWRVLFDIVFAPDWMVEITPHGSTIEIVATNKKL